MGGSLGLKGKPVWLGRRSLWQVSTTSHLPEYKPTGVHVDPEESISGEVDGPLQHLRSHVPSRPHLSMGVSNHLPRSELKRKSKVSNAGGHVTLDEDIFGLEIPVGDCWLQTLALVGTKFTMQVCQSFGHGKADFEEVAKTSVLMETCNKPELNLESLPPFVDTKEL